jgi:hypothetical protein
MCVMRWSVIRKSGLSGDERGTGCVRLQVRRLSLWWGRVASMRIHVFHEHSTVKRQTVVPQLWGNWCCRQELEGICGSFQLNLNMFLYHFRCVFYSTDGQLGKIISFNYKVTTHSV